jgi:hypothetical protein
MTEFSTAHIKNHSSHMNLDGDKICTTIVAFVKIYNFII